MNDISYHQIVDDLLDLQGEIGMKLLPGTRGTPDNIHIILCNLNQSLRLITIALGKLAIESNSKPDVIAEA